MLRLVDTVFFENNTIDCWLITDENNRIIKYRYEDKYGKDMPPIKVIKEF
jgi:hypothetical protein